jgi:hypothetical protein
MNIEQEIREKFQKETCGIEEIKQSCSNIFGHELKDQQCLTMLRVSREDFFLNYSETGAGKTKAGIATAYHNYLKHTIVFCPHSVIGRTWMRQINQANFVKEENVVANEILTEFGDDDFTFEVWNYDKFNTEGKADSRLKEIIKSKRYDFVIFDEVHRLKNKNSNTYNSLMKFLQTLRKLNPQVKIYACTATPTTTSIRDLQGIYEIISGKKADELISGSLSSQLINGNKILETSGFGYFPKSKMEVRYNGIDSETLFKSKGKAIFGTELANIDGTSIEEECIKHRGNMSKIEELHLLLKFNAYKHLIKKGTVIYTEYTYGDKMLFELKDLVEDRLHLSACIYSGEYKEYDGDCKENKDGYLKTSIDDFIENNKDILIGTKSMCEGVDGIQWVSNRVILHTIPSVWSVLHQLIGRFDREGSYFVDEGVDVFVPMVVFQDGEGSTVSFDRDRRWGLSMYRKIKDDVTKGGHLEEISSAEEERIVDEIIFKLKNKHEMTEIKREDVEISGFDDISVEWHKKESIISDFNRRGKTTNSRRFHKEITENPKEWYEYHKARNESMKTWNEIPYEYIASKIKNKNRIVADFGCGENLMKDLILENRVFSFDHIAIDDSVISCDMAHTPLEDNSIDIAVFSLALWGTNFEDYFKEAYRLLTYDGLMYIAEPSKSYSQKQRNELVEMLNQNGFTMVGDIEDRGKFFYITVIKK